MRINSFLIAIAFGFSGFTTAPAESPSIEENGIIVLEFEDLTYAGTEWRLQTARSGWNGRGYLRWEGPDSFTSKNNGRIDFPIRISRAGKYNLRMYSQHNGFAPDAENDVWVKLSSEGEGSWRKLFSNKGTGQLGKWDWDSRFDFSHSNQPNASFDFPAGDHVIQFAGRSRLMMMDRIHLYQDNVSNPLDLSRPPSRKQVRGHDFGNADAHGFKASSAPPLEVPRFSEDGRGLTISHRATNETTFGSWGGQIPDTVMAAGDLWEVDFYVTTNISNPDQRSRIPAFRLRVNDSGFQSTMEQQVDSLGNNLAVPAPGEVRKYTIPYSATEAVAGNSLRGSLDFIYVPNRGDDPTIELILARIEARKVR